MSTPQGNSGLRPGHVFGRVRLTLADGAAAEFGTNLEMSDIKNKEIDNEMEEVKTSDLSMDDFFELFFLQKDFAGDLALGLGMIPVEETLSLRCRVEKNPAKGEAKASASKRLEETTSDLDSASISLTSFFKKSSQRDHPNFPDDERNKRKKDSASVVNPSDEKTSMTKRDSDEPLDKVSVETNDIRRKKGEKEHMITGLYVGHREAMRQANEEREKGLQLAREALIRSLDKEDLLKKAKIDLEKWKKETSSNLKGTYQKSLTTTTTIGCLEVFKDRVEKTREDTNSKEIRALRRELTTLRARMEAKFENEKRKASEASGAVERYLQELKVLRKERESMRSTLAHTSVFTSTTHWEVHRAPAMMENTTKGGI
ncbi:hypothetical protein G5I_01186 [Acromyrmex echinatior]|uniref:Uncharacterized protein n=1 Tax=Acromyrmex echinatior TaxID=103372 RepID=F4W6X9_ACREC|nr:hypothetical protein G5I_01186 [Acromyrmex echinatior]